MRRMLHAACVALFFVAGCAGTRPPLTCPADGGPTWHELRSPHFVLQTDVELDRAGRAVVEFERLAAALQVATRSEHFGAPIRIVLFADKAAYDTFGPAHTAGYSVPQLPGDPEGSRSIVFVDSPGTLAQMRFLHELDHQFNHQRFFSLPRWLDEGLAEYASTLTIDGNDVHIGGENPRYDFGDDYYSNTRWSRGIYRRQIDPSRALSVDALLRAPREDFLAEDNYVVYATAWKLVTMLENGPNGTDTRAFQSMLTKMEQGMPSDTAFDEAFGTDHTRLDGELSAYLTVDHFARPTFVLPTLEDTPYETYVLPDAKVHVLWAELAPEALLATGFAAHQLDRALAADGKSIDVRFARAIQFARVRQWSAAHAEIDTALRSAPDDPRLLLVGSSVRRAEYKASSGKPDQAWRIETRALADHLARTARTAREVDEVGVAHAMAGDLEEGRQYIEMALKVDPLCSLCWLHDATVLVDLGRPEEARRPLDRVLGLDSDSALPPALQPLIQRLVKATKKGK